MGFRLEMQRDNAVDGDSDSSAWLLELELDGMSNSHSTSLLRETIDLPVIENSCRNCNLSDKILQQSATNESVRMLGCENPSAKHFTSTVTVWLVILTLTGLGLIMYGVFQEQQLEYKKLNVGVGSILLLCMFMFVSFLIIDTKRLRKYILHMLVPWCAGITIIVIGILVAFLVHFINFKLFLITSLPLSSLAFFTFNEIYHYIGKMRVSPMYFNRYRTAPEREEIVSARQLRTSSRLLHFRPDTAARSRQPGSTTSPSRQSGSVQSRQSIALVSKGSGSISRSSQFSRGDSSGNSVPMKGSTPPKKQTLPAMQSPASRLRVVAQPPVKK